MAMKRELLDKTRNDYRWFFPWDYGRVYGEISPKATVTPHEIQVKLCRVVFI